MSSYKETLDWMFSKLPMYQRVGVAAYRPGLEAMKKLDAYLNHPHEKFKSIHIGGTNGKAPRRICSHRYYRKLAIRLDSIHLHIYLIIESE